MTTAPSRLNHPATPLSAPWADEQAQTHHTPTRAARIARIAREVGKQ